MKVEDTVTKLESTNVTMETELKCVAQENRSLQEGICNMEEENKKLKARLDSTKGVHVSKQPRKRERWEEYSERRKKRKIQVLKERAVNTLTDDQFELEETKTMTVLVALKFAFETIR